MPAAQLTGLPPNVEPWSPGANAPAASSATSRQPIGRPFASPFASVTRSGRTPSCSKAKNVPVRPTPGLDLVEAEQRAERGRGAATNARRQRHDAALPEHRLEQDQRRCRRRPPPRARRRRSERRSGRPAAAARRRCAWPAGRSPRARRASGRGSRPRARRRPVLPVALRAYLSAASIASAPELQRNACAPAPPKRAESRAASAAAGSVA